MPDISTIRVPADFEFEFPGASRSASDVAVNLARAQMALIAEIEHRALLTRFLPPYTGILRLVNSRPVMAEASSHSITIAPSWICLRT